ncbi:MAG: class I SAM-dependent methyltransferase [SAR202 cluster bacterium]|nr:class I SAM-dependent methyltransferase [SAR202 cluster bacterium]
MSQRPGESTDQIYAQLYDVSVSDWPGEIEFYRSLIRESQPGDTRLLEVACGTGRVALQLAQDDATVVGLDHSESMLEVARSKSADLQNVRWVGGDMRSFDLGERFALAIIPGHGFQNLVEPDDQIACLESIKRHLLPDGMLVVHLDHMGHENTIWLGGLRSGKGGVFASGQDIIHPETGHRVRISYAWTYEPSTQTASVLTVWEELDANGEVVSRRERGPIPLHCVFRFEMEHLLGRAGFEIEAVYGDFFRGVLKDDSSDMVWVARNRSVSK